MECYFGTFALPDQNSLEKSAVVAFHIPEIGIRFKAPFDAVDHCHSAYASLLALLEFIDSNQKYFSKHGYQIFGNNLAVINQVNKVQASPELYQHLLEKALGYRDKYGFSLQWVPSTGNSALSGLLD